MQKMTQLGVNECVFSDVKRWQRSGDAPNMWLTGFHASLMDRIKQHTRLHGWLGTSSLSCLDCFWVSSGSWDVLREETTVVVGSEANPSEPALLSCRISQKRWTFLWMSPSNLAALSPLWHQLGPNSSLYSHDLLMLSLFFELQTFF